MPVGHRNRSKAFQTNIQENILLPGMKVYYFLVQMYQQVIHWPTIHIGVQITDSLVSFWGAKLLGKKKARI